MPLPSAWKTGLAGRWEAKAAGYGRRRTLPPGASHAARRGECHRRASPEIIALAGVIDRGVWLANREGDYFSAQKCGLSKCNANSHLSNIVRPGPYRVQMGPQTYHRWYGTGTSRGIS